MVMHERTQELCSTWPWFQISLKVIRKVPMIASC